MATYLIYTTCGFSMCNCKFTYMVEEMVGKQDACLKKPDTVSAATKAICQVDKKNTNLTRPTV